MRPTKGSASLAIVAVAIGIATGISLVLAVAPQEPPDSIGKAGQSPVTVPLNEEVFRDPHTVELSVVLGAPPRLVATRSGTVTRFDCAVGGALNSGSAALWINGVPQLALATTTPLWRDLKLGDHGPDVLSLQRELSRLGFSAGTDGRYDSRTDDALARAFARIGGRKGSKGLMIDRITWIPKPIVSYATCETALGVAIAPGSPIATTSGEIKGLALKVVPTNAVQGPRVVVVAGVTAQVNQAGQVMVTSGVATIAETAVAQSVQGSTQAVSLAAVYQLATPLTVYSAPPSVLVGLRGANGCVVTKGGQIVKVRVVSSILGRSLIAPLSGESIGDVLLTPPEDVLCTS